METSIRHKRIELRQAIVDLREHGLLMQAQWAAEQLAGLPADDDPSPLPPPAAPSAAQLDDAYLLARTHFDLKVRRTCLCLQAATLHHRNTAAAHTPCRVPPIPFMSFYDVTQPTSLARNGKSACGWVTTM